MENQTIAYYNQNAASFIQGTVSVDFQMTQDKFSNALPGKRVLDFGNRCVIQMAEFPGFMIMGWIWLLLMMVSALMSPKSRFFPIC